MKFSVLCSLYKNERVEYFDAMLKSMFSQTLLPSEILIVQDGPLTEDLYLLCNEYKKRYPELIRLIPIENNVGLGRALRIGIEKCSYDIIARMDTDDIAKKNRFQKQIGEFMNDSNLALVGSSIDEFSESTDKVLTIREMPLSLSEIKKYAKKRNPFNHMTVMYRKEAVIKSGSYQDFLWLEDYHLWIRMILNGYNMKNIKESLVWARADASMFQRRGGLKYFLQEIKFQNFLFKEHYINLFEYFTNLAIRAVVRTVPNEVRGIIYKNFLRK